METITNWLKTAAASNKTRSPVVLMVDQEDCPYCRRVEGEFFAGILASGEFSGKAIFGKISIDDGEYIVDQHGERVSTRSFLDKLNTNFTPTILFLDGERNELVDKMIGMSTPDFYGYYLERAISQAIAAMRQAA